MSAFHDMHCHLSFMANAGDVAADACAAGTLLFANTVTPEEWLRDSRRFAEWGNVTVGFGMHPWWVSGIGDKDMVNADRPSPEALRDAGDSRQLAAGLRERVGSFTALLEEHRPRVIGEIGLDLGKRHAITCSEQFAAFREVASWAAHAGNRLVSLHSVHAASEVLDELERCGALESCTCIFHWFTGPSDQLKRAVQAGCYFSVGPRMLATGKGREYVKAVPAGRLLLETDAPPRQGEPYSFAELQAELGKAAEGIAAIKGDEVLVQIAETSERLLNT